MATKQYKPKIDVPETQDEIQGRCKHKYDGPAHCSEPQCPWRTCSRCNHTKVVNPRKESV